MKDKIEESTRFRQFVQNIETSISRLTNLEIKTIIGDYRYESEESVAAKKEGDFKVMHSKINLIDGDVTTHISNDLVSEKYAWIRDFHAQKELKGHEIINGNIKAIISLFELYHKTKNVNFRDEDIDETQFETAPKTEI